MAQRSQFSCNLALAALCLLSVSYAQAAPTSAEVATAVKLQADGNYQEALSAYLRLFETNRLTSADAVEALEGSVICLRQLNRTNEFDSFMEPLLKQYADDWLVLAAVARGYSTVNHTGYLVAGEFYRGNHRGGGKVMNADARDRTRSLQVFSQALQLLQSQPADRNSREARELLIHFARTLRYSWGNSQSWRLQRRTDLGTLPDYEEGWSSFHSATQGAPIDADGDPIFYDVPKSWEAADNDGQRWRWVLATLERWQPQNRSVALYLRARFLRTQFGVETLAHYSWWFGRQGSEQEQQDSGTFALHELGESETIARLATGIKRFDLPDEHNHIKLQQQIVELGDKNPATPHLEDAIRNLATTFTNRRQFSRAAEYWQLALDHDGNNPTARQQLNQITKNWGRFEPISTQPAGKGATIDFRFRNGNRVEFIAHRIKVPELLADVKEILKSHDGKRVDWDQIRIEQLGYRLITKGDEKYLGAEQARWSLDLEPLENHFDRRITVTTPLQKPGAYLLTSKMIDGNTTSIVVWLNDTAIVKKPLEGKSLYYVADAITGKPISKCNVEMFGYWNEHLDANKYKMHTENFAQFTDNQGLIELSVNDKNGRFSWLATATTKDGRFAYLGFRNVWAGQYYDQQYQQVKTFAVTDRPVYRPEQEVHFKFWVRQAQYDLKDESRFAAQTFQVEIRNPKNEKVYTTQITSDAYGGIAGSWTIPAGATLGQYRANVLNHGGGYFRVEEYKKPEFEVTIEAPSKPVALGDKVTAKIDARYYFGSPVTEATVKYKVLRTPYSQDWFPPMPWDWLYGPGYWWFSYDYPWYPGWGRWGCLAPWPSWFWQQPSPPELISEHEVPIGPDGTVEVEIDTSVAKQFHPDQDHSYQIQAEVVDRSRRTIVANGQVLVAREPFKVFVWTSGGHYRVGDTIQVGTAARTLDGSPVVGKGTLRLLKIRYEEGEAIETETGSWDLPMGESGQAQLQIKASESGQYRLSYRLIDEAGHEIEGGQIVTIAGEGFDGSQFRFNDLELVPDRREYQPGDKVKLRINTNRTGASVLLFLRPSNSVYLDPQLISLDGKSQEIEIDVVDKDTPNFFVEAVTVHGGRTHTVVRELFVPPAKRVLNLEVVPSADAYLPDQQAKFTVKVTDQEGLPFIGSLALSIYDKAVEYIAGGSNVADIREFFWKWRRTHRPTAETNLQRYSRTQVKPNSPMMQNLGIFGETIIDEVTDQSSSGRSSRFTGRSQIMSKSSISGPMSLGRAGEFSADFGVPMAATSAGGLAVEEAGEFNERLPAESASNTVEPTIRENFADTALWTGSLKTNAEGLAEVELTMPQNLTTWKVRAWGVGHGTRVGEGSAEVVTRKNIIIRLQAPRFFVERDQVVLSANVHNYLDTEKQVRVVLQLEGDCLESLAPLEQNVTIAANGEQRIDWRVRATREGDAKITMSALTDEESDAMAMTFPVHVHGMLKTESYTGVIRPTDATGKFIVTVPAERRAEQTRLEVRYTPTLAGAMVDALPYLLDYPYGCTEQTLNRFLPAVITQQTLQQMNLDLAAIGEKRTNLNSQEIGDDSERAKQWQRFDRNPVFDNAEMDAIVTKGVNRLTAMQLSDGGWGWFSGFGERSYPYTTAVVVHGLLKAEENGVALVPGVVDRGVKWLERYQAEQVRLLDRAQRGETEEIKHRVDNLDALVHMVLSEARRASSNEQRANSSPDQQASNNQQRAESSPTSAHTAMTRHLYRDRKHLAVYSLATYGLSLHMLGETDKLQMVVRNLNQFVQQDEENQTAWLNLPGGYWWYWYGSDNEAMAYYLKLLVATDPDNAIAPRLVKYLLNNRKHSTYWRSTRDTALVVEAFAEYLHATGEDDPNLTLEVWIDGQQRKQVEISQENLFTFDNKLVLTGEELAAGRHNIELRKQGDSPLYYNGYLTNFTLEDEITAAGLELKVNRKYYKLTPVAATTDVAGGHGQVVSQAVQKYERTEIVNHADVESGELVEVELTVESKNDYEYILLEDMKAAGFEPVAIRSGYNGNELGAYVELRDDRVSLLVARLARGRHSVSYRLRAETPGRFTALPTRASAMYAPELRANSDGLKVEIVE